jgi:3-deoxy-D-manno-octulosonic acid kinase
MPDPIGEVPPGYVVHRVADCWLVLDRGRVPVLVALRLADPVGRKALFSRAPLRGRGAAPTVPLASGASVVLRRYRHGGLLAALTGRLFWGPGRAVEELRVTTRAERALAPVPHVLCLGAWPVVGPLWSALIGTLEEEGARDLLAAAAEIGAAHPPREASRARCALAREVGRAIRRLHDAGVEHRDLQLRNVLLACRDGQQRVVVVDLDRARFHPGEALETPRRARNLGRLIRSGVKATYTGAELGRRELAALLAGYTEGDRSLRSALRDLAARERAKLALHRLTYRFRSGVPGP